MTDAYGNIIATIGSGEDITERKRLEEELRRNLKIFDSFLENSPVYIFLKDKELRSLMLSRNYEQMLGMPLENLLGKTMYELFPSDLAKSMVEDDKLILALGRVNTIVENLGEKIYETTKFPIFFDGKPEMLAGFTLDITERKQAEESLRKAHNELEKRIEERTQDLKKTHEMLLHTEKLAAIGGLSTCPKLF